MNNAKKAVHEMSGMELLTCVAEGRCPGPAMASTIPMAIESVKEGEARFTAMAGNQHLNPMGGVHGGFAATVLDSVTGCAVHTLLEPGEGYATVDLNIKMLRPVPTGKKLIAVGSVIHKGRNLGVSEGSLKDEQGKIYAHATATCMIFKQ